MTLITRISTDKNFFTADGRGYKRIMNRRDRRHSTSSPKSEKPGLTTDQP
jgi:hypothetical protein